MPIEFNSDPHPVIFGIPYEDIQTGDTATVLGALNLFLETRERVLWGQGRITIVFEGYDDDSREVWCIPEIRRYTRKLDEQFP